MNALLRIWAVFVVAAKRLLSQRWLALATALGLITTVALTTGTPLYADAVYYRVLREELWERQRSHPPFAFMFRYIGAWGGSEQWENVQPVDTYLTGPAGAALGLPRQFVVRYFKTDVFQLFPREGVAYTEVTDPLTWTSFAFASDIQDHVTILEGGFPAAAIPAQDSTIEVLVSEELALELGLQVGEAYTAYASRQTEDGKRVIQIPVQIAGVWRPVDPQEGYWFYNPQALDDVMLVPEETFVNRISPYLEDEVYLGMWYW